MTTKEIFICVGIVVAAFVSVLIVLCYADVQKERDKDALEKEQNYEGYSEL
jgi:hypothetical protein